MTKFLAAIAGVAMSLCAAQAAQNEAGVWSPDHQYYVKAFYVEIRPDQINAPGTERARLVVYSAVGQEITTAHIWNVEPDGTMREGIRGCESFGWVDNTRIYCSGTTGPRAIVTLVFDSRTGRELDDSVEMRP